MSVASAPKPKFDEEAEYAKLKDEDFDDPEGFVDDIILPGNEKIDIITPMINSTKDSILIVENIPIVGQDKKEKLEKILNNLIRSTETKLKKMHLPIENNNTKGFMFLVFESPEDRLKVQKVLHNYKLDLKHNFQCFTLKDWKQSDKTNDKRADLVPRKYTELESRWNWLLNDSISGYFAITESKGNLTIFKTSPIEKKLVLNDFSRFPVSWSPNGTYLLSFHPKGVMLRTYSDGFEVYGKFPHEGVSKGHFSPREGFLITYGTALESRTMTTMTDIMIWDITTRLPVKKITGDHSQWPPFKWSHDESYFAKIFEDSLFIYETKTFNLLDGKPLKIANLKDFIFSPTDNSIAYWQKVEGNAPSRIALRKLPTHQESIVRQVFNLVSCQMYWHEKGERLALVVKRNFKKNAVYNIDIVHSHQGNFLVESLEFSEEILNFSWDPTSENFVAFTFSTVSIFKLENGKFNRAKFIEDVCYRQGHWSPVGRIVVLSDADDIGVHFEFWDVKEMFLLSRDEHVSANHLLWDSTGQYFLTYIEANESTETNLIIWSCSGNKLTTIDHSSLWNIAWRPRIKFLLSDSELEEISKNIPQYEQKFSGSLKLRSSILEKDHSGGDNQGISQLLSFYFSPDAVKLANYHMECCENLNLIDTNSYDKYLDQSSTVKEYSFSLLSVN